MIYSVLIIIAAIFACTSGTLLFLFFQQSRESIELRKNLQKAKNETENIVQFLIHDPYPFIQISREGKVIFANPATYSQYIGLSQEKFDHPVLSGLENMFGSHKKHTRDILIDEKTWHQEITPITSNDQETLAIYCYDVSERKEFEVQLEQSKRSAEAANQAKSNFLANMSHELRTPMNGILGISDLLIHMEIDEKARELSKILNSSARNLLALVNDILDFSKIEAGELSLEKIPFNLYETLDQIIKLQTPVATKKNLTLASNIQTDIPSYFIGDPVRIQQILNNLINNAIKFTEKGSIYIETSCLKNKDLYTTTIKVIDTGIGIPQDKQELIFKKFTQADVSTARKYGGTGLGLSITKQLVEMMGGTITLESTPGTGTTFSIIIPMHNIDEHDVIKKKETKTASFDTTTKILIVDDHPVNLLVIRNILMSFGFSDIDEAKNGAEAICMFEQSNYPFILMDCQMPDMDGFTASQHIRKKHNKLGPPPIIVAVTANAMKEARNKCLAAGMNDYISKPVESEKLYELLQKWLPEKIFLTMQKPKESSASTREIINWNRINECTQGDGEQKKEIIALFSTQTQEALKELEASFQNSNHQKWEQYAHKLHGSASNFGAQIFAEICGEAEHLTTADTEKKKQALIEIFTHYKELKKRLQ